MKEYCGYPHEETCYHDGESEKTIYRDCEGCEWVTVTEPEAPKSPTPFGLLERLVRWFLFGLKWCLRIPMACIFWGFLACCLAVAKFAEGIEWLYDWTNKTT